MLGCCRLETQWYYQLVFIFFTMKYKTGQVHKMDEIKNYYYRNMWLKTVFHRWKTGNIKTPLHFTETHCLSHILFNLVFFFVFSAPETCIILLTSVTPINSINREKKKKIKNKKIKYQNIKMRTSRVGNLFNSKYFLCLHIMYFYSHIN